jgi:predicted regulator of Ras-like GTPase activity (Roadblock/LC7/MglB family)
MAFPFSNWFKSKDGQPPVDPAPDKAAAQPGANPPPPPSPLAAKSVTPRAAQPAPKLHEAAPRPTISLPIGAPVSLTGPVQSPPPQSAAGRGKISFPGLQSGGGAHPPASEAAPAAPVASYSPPPPAIPQISVTLELGDFLDRIPVNFLLPGPFERQQPIEFLASELYSDLARGRATVPASTIYHKCPQIFARPVSETEDVEIYLPLNKLVEQMGAALQPRPDQVAEENVAEIETPFLQVAMEDNVRLAKAPGTSMGATVRPMGAPPQPGPAHRSPSAGVPATPPAPVAAQPNLRAAHRTGQISPITPIRPPADASNPPMAAPTAQSAGPIMSSKRPPSTVRASVAGGKIRLSGPAVSSRSFVPAPNPPAPPPMPSGAEPPAEEPGAGPRGVNPIAPTPLAHSPSHQVTKKTARIQIPPISLRPAGAGSSPRGPMPPTQGSAPGPAPARPPAAEPMPNFNATPSVRPSVPPPPMTFRSTPPPPPSAKPVPSSFAPMRPAAFPPPAFPAAPPPPPPPGLTAVSAPGSDARPVSPFASLAHSQRIEMSLAAVLRGLPASALNVDPSSIPEEVRFSLPFALIEPQLSQGRVVLPLEVFSRALPEAHRDVLAADSGLTEVSIPLQEVFQNLPANALARRMDQVEDSVGTQFPTPFSQKAEEDAQRFAAPPESLATIPAIEEPTAETAPAVEPEAPAREEEILPIPEDETATGGTESDAVGAEPPQESEIESVPLTNEPDADAPAEVRNRESEPEAPVAEDFQEVEPPDAQFELPALSALPVEETHAELPALETPQEEPFLETEREPIEPAAEFPVESIAPEPVAEETAPVMEAPVSPEQPLAVEIPPLSLIQPEAATAEAEPAPIEAEEPSFQLPTLAVPAPEEKEAEPAAAQMEAPKETPLPAPAALPELRDTLLEPSGPPTREQDTELQTLFMTEDELDAKTVVRLVNQLPGIEGCMVMFSDGLLLAGGLPHLDDPEGFCAMAPTFYQRSLNFTGELALGGLQGLTLYTEHGLLSFFMHEDICLSVSHAGRGFLPGVREKLNIVTRELARMYPTAVKPGTNPPPHRD